MRGSRALWAEHLEYTAMEREPQTHTVHNLNDGTFRTCRVYNNGDIVMFRTVMRDGTPQRVACTVGNCKVQGITTYLERKG